MQINGKLRAVVAMPAACSREEAIALAKEDSRVAAALDGKQIVKEIVVPGKIVNLVVR